MITMCRRCGHRVRAALGLADGRGILTYFDDDETSVSYDEHVVRCPACGQRLAGEGLRGSQPVASLTAREIAEALGISAEAARALESSAAPDGDRKTK